MAASDDTFSIWTILRKNTLAKGTCNKNSNFLRFRCSRPAGPQISLSNLNTRNLSHKLSKQTTRQPSISFVIHDHRRDERFRTIPKIFVSLLAPKYILLLLNFFRKTNSTAIATTGAWAVVTKTKNVQYNSSNENCKS